MSSIPFKKYVTYKRFTKNFYIYLSTLATELTIDTSVMQSSSNE